MFIISKALKVSAGGKYSQQSCPLVVVSTDSLTSCDDKTFNAMAPSCIISDGKTTLIMKHIGEMNSYNKYARVFLETMTLGTKRCTRSLL